MVEERAFGTWLREQRKQRDLTQDALAEQVGCSPDMIRKIEQGSARPSRPLADLLLASLDVPPAERPAFVGWARGSGPPPSGVGPVVGAPRTPTVGGPTVPTGTITFLFTDIEGSTAHWAAHPAAMAAAVARHDDLLRTAITTHRGHIFKTGGDAFYAAFVIPADAVAAAQAVQQ